MNNCVARDFSDKSNTNNMIVVNIYIALILEKPVVTSLAM